MFQLNYQSNFNSKPPSIREQQLPQRLHCCQQQPTESIILQMKHSREANLLPHLFQTNFCNKQPSIDSDSLTCRVPRDKTPTVYNCRATQLTRQLAGRTDHHRYHYCNTLLNPTEINKIIHSKT